MFETIGCVATSGIRACAAELADRPLPEGDAARIDEIRELEELKCAAEAGQARLAAGLADNPGTAGQVALARRESHHRGKQYLGLARILDREMPCTMAAFLAGRITEHRATILARETACLSLDDRRSIDRAIGGDQEALESYGDGQLEAEVKKMAYRLDPESFVARRRKAESDRRVTVRPAPDVMTHLSALLPVGQGVAVYAALCRRADTLRAAGDARGRGQIMADTLVERVLGIASPAETPVAVNLVMTDRALFAGADDPAHIDGHGPVPADLARELATGHRRWLRRLYTRPESGELLAMDKRSRLFPESLALLIRLRDQRCRTPWCDAPIRHIDHPTRVADGGETSGRNGQGLCEACNYAKDAVGWTARPRPGHVVETTTPTGHSYRSRAPAITAPEARARSWLEAAFVDLVLAC